MGVDGLMSDQLFIEQNSELVTDILLQVQEETIEQLYKLKGQRKADEFAIFLQDLDVKEIIRAKASNAINIYDASHGVMLQTIQGFAAISEETLVALKNYSTESLLNQLDNMAQIIKKEVVNGIIAGTPTQTVLEAVRGQGALSRRQLQTLIDTSMNEYSRSVTKVMIDSMPKDTKYVYIGALDSKTRPECLDMMSAGEQTKEEIESNFSQYGNVFINGGGYNCRHKWEIAVQDKFGHDKKGAKKLFDALPKKDLN